MWQMALRVSQEVLQDDDEHPQEVEVGEVFEDRAGVAVHKYCDVVVEVSSSLGVIHVAQFLKVEADTFSIVRQMFHERVVVTS